MNEIKLLDKDTIDKIAAGEVVERPSSVVKELLENSVDSGASAISVEIKNGGTDLIRVTDNGSGIERDQIKKALLRHFTSKIKDAGDLSCVKTLGFRGEALSSICAVSRFEILTKTAESITGTIYRTNGGTEGDLKEAGLPDGTTVIVRDLFYNVPARLKFLKSAKTEGGYISEIIEKLALSNPDISFKYTNNGQVKLITPGNGSLKDAVFSVFGRDISLNLLEVDAKDDLISIKGFIGKPQIARSGRMLENYFINGRYVKDKIVSKALEDAYYGYQMKGTFPFSCFNITIDPELIDVNVHPSKLEIKFFDSQRVYDSVYKIISQILHQRENIPEFTINIKQAEAEDADKEESCVSLKKEEIRPAKISYPEPFEAKRFSEQNIFFEKRDEYTAARSDEKYEQTTLFNNKFISEEAAARLKMIGQIFETYWIVEYAGKMYMIDQHAAHEKVLYEKFRSQIESGKAFSQSLSPAVIVTLSSPEEVIFNDNIEFFKKAGFEAEHFGRAEYALICVPSTLYSSVNEKDLFLDMLSELSQIGRIRPETLLDRIAAAACKAAVKGNKTLTFKEARELINSLLSLENPYNCPHGRPTMISMSKYELDKKFKRII